MKIRDPYWHYRLAKTTVDILPKVNKLNIICCVSWILRRWRLWYSKKDASQHVSEKPGNEPLGGVLLNSLASTDSLTIWILQRNVKHWGEKFGLMLVRYAICALHLIQIQYIDICFDYCTVQKCLPWLKWIACAKRDQRSLSCWLLNYIKRTVLYPRLRSSRLFSLPLLSLFADCLSGHTN